MIVNLQGSYHSACPGWTVFLEQPAHEFPQKPRVADFALRLKFTVFPIGSCHCKGVYSE